MHGAEPSWRSALKSFFFFFSSSLVFSDAVMPCGAGVVAACASAPLLVHSCAILHVHPCYLHVGVCSGHPCYRYYILATYTWGFALAIRPTVHPCYLTRGLCSGRTACHPLSIGSFANAQMGPSSRVRTCGVCNCGESHAVPAFEDTRTPFKLILSCLLRPF